MDAAERQGNLLAILENAALAHKDWVENSDATLIPEDVLYARFQEIADQAKVIFAPRASRLEAAFVAFAPHWAAFVSQQQATADPTMLPGAELWAAWEKLHSELMQTRLPRLKRVESIAELREQKVPLAQICKIYGFLDEGGNADIQQLQEEIEKPGTHTGNGWVAPVNRLLAQQINALRTEASTLSQRRTSKIAAATTPAKESIDQLVACGVSAQQIARLKRITTDEVYAYCQQHGLPAPAHDYTDLLQTPGPHDPSISPERQQAMDMLGPDQSRQFAPLGNEVGGNEDIGDASDEGTDIDPEESAGLDLSQYSLEEQNQISEAVGYFNQGLDVAAIAGAMNLHGNSVRGLLRKAGINLARST